MDTIGKAKHEAEIADVAERRLRLRSLELAVESAGPGKSPVTVIGAAVAFLNFLIGIDDAGK